jgi:hypothetical protein
MNAIVVGPSEAREEAGMLLRVSPSVLAEQGLIWLTAHLVASGGVGRP